MPYDSYSYVKEMPQLTDSPCTHKVRGARFNPTIDMIINVKSPYTASKVDLRDIAAYWYLQLLEAAHNDGIEVEKGELDIWSGLRTFDRQAQLFSKKCKAIAASNKKLGVVMTEAEIKKIARKWVAPPGTSAHETGLAIDFNIGRYKYLKENIPKMKKTKTYTWLLENASRFGFYNYNPEPWHWVYNPKGVRRI